MNYPLQCLCALLPQPGFVCSVYTEYSWTDLDIKYLLQWVKARFQDDLNVVVSRGQRPSAAENTQTIKTLQSFCAL